MGTTCKNNEQCVSRCQALISKQQQSWKRKLWAWISTGRRAVRTGNSLQQKTARFYKAQREHAESRQEEEELKTWKQSIRRLQTIIYVDHAVPTCCST